MKPLTIITAVCVLIIVVSLGQVAARSCTLAYPTNAPDRRMVVCLVRLP